MLYYLHNFSEYFGPLRLFEYISFRAGGAFFTAFLLTVFAIPPLLPFFPDSRAASGRPAPISTAAATPRCTGRSCASAWPPTACACCNWTYDYDEVRYPHLQKAQSSCDCFAQHIDG